MIKFLKWAFKNVKEAVILMLILVLLGLGWMYDRKNKQIAQMSTQIMGLEEDLKQKVTITNDSVKIVYRDKEGKVVYIDRYLPTEGSVIVSQSTDTTKTDVVTIKDKGFCFQPGFGFVWSDELLPTFDIKLAYWKRYSFTAPSVNSQYAGIGVSRHVDDLLSWTGVKFKNVEIQINGGLAYKGGYRMGIGLRSNF